MIRNHWGVEIRRGMIAEVHCIRGGKPGYRWTTGYCVVGPDCRKQYPPMVRRDAYASARAQWPNCVISVKDDE